MSVLRVRKVIIDNTRISVEYDVSGEISQYFNIEEDFFVDYNKDISMVPESVAVIPFVLNVLPIIWFFDAKLHIPQLDLSFYNSLNQIRNGYAEMFKYASFKGEVVVDNLKDNSVDNPVGCCSFFSGGVDATSTLVSVIKENPILMTLWGADIKFDDLIGRDNILNMLEETKNKFSLDGYFIKSSFRRFIYEGELTRDVSSVINDNYWHGLQHGIGLIGHAAPIVYKHKLKTVYIPGTESVHSRLNCCASHPIIDEKVKMLSASVIHEGFEFDRQGKIDNIVKFETINSVSFNLRVCWVSSGGVNCNKCEKCVRTICGILACGQNPNDFGFIYKAKDQVYFKSLILHKIEMDVQRMEFWNDIKRACNDNSKIISKDIVWLKDFNYYSRYNRIMRKYYLWRGIFVQKSRSIFYKIIK